MAMILVDVVIKSLVDHEFYQISNGLLLPVKSHILSRSKPAMLADSELTVTNKCSDVDGPPLKKVFLGRSHIPLPCGVGCGHYRLAFAM